MTVHKHRSRCFLDVDIEGENVGRVIVELFSDVCPITSENFRALCTGEKGKGKSGSTLHYKGVPFHRIVKGFMIQGGDFVEGNGTSGESIYGGLFKDENFEYTHGEPFVLSMANKGKDSNGSQFFITTRPAPHLDGKNTVFGRVISGKNVVVEIENVPTDPSCRPLQSVSISNCGELIPSLKRKKQKKSLSESLDSGSENEDAKDRRKKRKKHSKKHKKERQRKDIEQPPYPSENDFGVKVNPDEIPSVPVNNFLLRRTSPMRDDRMPERDFYRHRQTQSKSGRKIKGRGLMRFRTPSRSRSRSRSNTPPHWKQAQSRLRKMSEVEKMMDKELTPSDQSPSEKDEEEEQFGLEIVPQSNLQKRLGMTSIRDRDRNEPFPLRHNNRDREWSHDSSPGRDRRQGFSHSGLRSMVTVTSKYNQESEDWHDDQYRNFRRSRRSPNHERRYPNYERRNEHRRERSRDNPRLPNETEAVKAPPQKKPVDPQKLKSLESSLFRYHKDIKPSDSTLQNKDKNKGQRQKDGQDKKDPKDNAAKHTHHRNKKDESKSAHVVSSLTNELFRYQRKNQSNEKNHKKDIKAPSIKKETSSVKTAPEKDSDSRNIVSEEEAAVKEASIPFLNEHEAPAPKEDSLQSNEVPCAVGEKASESPKKSETQDASEDHVKVKERRRWDMKEQKEPFVCEVPTCDIPMPDLIPLPNEVSVSHESVERTSETEINTEKDINNTNVQDDISDAKNADEEVDTYDPGTNVIIKQEKPSSPISTHRSPSRSKSKSPAKIMKNRSKSPVSRRSSHSSNSHKSRSKSPVKKFARQHSRSRSKSPVRKRLSRSTPDRKTRRSRSKSPRSRPARRNRSRSSSRHRYDRNRRSPPTRRGGYRRGSPDRRGGYQKSAALRRGRDRRSRSPIRRRRHSRSSSSGSSSSNSSSSSGKKATAKGEKAKRQRPSSSSSSSSSAST